MLSCDVRQARPRRKNSGERNDDRQRRRLLTEPGQVKRGTGGRLREHTVHLRNRRRIYGTHGHRHSDQRNNASEKQRPPNGLSSAAGRRRRSDAPGMIRSASEEGTAEGGPPERFTIRRATSGPAAGAIG